MNSYTLSPKKRKTLKTILIVLGVIILVILIKNHLEKRREIKELYAQAYEALKAPAQRPELTEEEMYAQAYEALKAPAPKN